MHNSARGNTFRTGRKSKGSPSPRTNKGGASNRRSWKQDDGIFSAVKLMEKTQLQRQNSNQSNKRKELTQIVNIRSFFNEIDNKKNNAVNNS